MFNTVSKEIRHSFILISPELCVCTEILYAALAMPCLLLFAKQNNFLSLFLQRCTKNRGLTSMINQGHALYCVIIAGGNKNILPVLIDIRV